MSGVKRTPCSDQSRARNDPMYGTASAGHAWAMFEIPGAWGHSAFLNSETILPPALGRAIARRAETAGMRVAAIRRPGRRSRDPRWRWFLARSDEGEEELWQGEVDAPEQYLDIALDGSDGQLLTDPLVAVCAHGKHDQCCAVRGRAATATIAERYPEFTWECSHLGGDRFAATMLILPEGLCYGRVDATDSARLVDLYLDGRLDNAFLRGRTCLPHPVQAAQYFARQASGEQRIAALSPLKVQRGEHQIRVLLASDSGPVEVVLAEEMSEPLLSMCHASVPGRVRTFVLVSIAAG
ncbi:sucrase ferredoxin [Mycobacterium vicinigordonae]|uniref:Sucrase ferredoxin n=1 Tax=Mycobacterium vicinigordonae TaxID=1719132 RepID=A0A7D6HSG5_9MYCO|nr:sucrase ferredoxin [Mycobacterium vicinigordonae]QLL06312.1 sucrase ferredoxin [Mycobacterium vicinigordonae]